MRRASPGLLLLALAPALPACFDLPKIDPGPRFIDDFEDGDLSPTWTALGDWTCDTFPIASDGADGGPTPAADGGPFGGGGEQIGCTIETPGAGDAHALLAQFQLTDPADGVRQHPGAEVVTRTRAGTVDLTGFTQLVFNAILTGTPELPAETQVLVELGCSIFPSDPIASQPVTGISLGGDWVRVPLMLAGFQQQNTSRSQACLSRVDSIQFVILPGLADGESAAGTLQLDNIKLQN